ncbi:MAG: glycosyl hydrolase family 28-related protein, partial [Acidimicrobiia bacterium]
MFYDDVALAHPDFSVSTVRAAAVAAGASTKVRVLTARTVGSARAIHLSVTHLPYGVTATWSHTSVEAGASSILTLTATNAALGASARVSVVGRSSSATHVVVLSLKVTTTGATWADREIDRPAINREFPTDAVVNVKTEFGARGNGVTDDTAAIRAAIAAGLGTGAPSLPHKTLYFPKGTYLVSGSLMWQLASGQWSTSLTFQGENRDQTIIKLKDHAPGFSNPAAPRAVIDTASNNASDARGSGNQAFDNFIFDLTVDVGRGNPGAIGIDYMANNRGAIRNVVVRAPSGSGLTGIAMTRPWPGPCLLQDVRVD